MKIQNELQAIFEELDAQKFGQFPGFGDETIYIEPDAEAVTKIAKAEVLVELLNLNKPMNYQPVDMVQSSFFCGWGYAMNSGQCCEGEI